MIYTIYTSFNDYVEDCKEIGLTPFPKSLYIDVLKTFFWKLSRAIIVDKYVWKIPQNLGYIQIVKMRIKNVRRLTSTSSFFMNYLRSGGDFFKWKWVKFSRSYRTNSTYYKTTKFQSASLYRFDPIRDKEGIGLTGLGQHIVECFDDPLVPNYNVLNLAQERTYVIK